MRNFLKLKKGDGSYSNVLITWIILIASVIILWYFLSLIDYSKSIDEQMCHLGVLSRGSTGEAKGVIPFSCKTSKLCLTRDGSCSEKGRKIEKVSSKEEVYEFLADKMADCWWLFGEGKYNFVENKVDSKDLYCSLCYDVLFDDSLKSIPGLSGDDTGKDAMMLSRIEFYRYLEKHEVSEGKTYSQYMQLPSADFLESNFQSSLLSEGSDVGVTEALKEFNIPKIDLNKRQYILMGAFNKMSKLQSGFSGGLKGLIASTSAIVIGSTLTAIGVIATPVTGGVSTYLIVLGGTAVGAGIDLIRTSIIDSKDLENKNFISTIIEGDSGNYYLTPTIVPAELNEQGYSDIAALGCKTITTSSASTS